MNCVDMEKNSYSIEMCCQNHSSQLLPVILMFNKMTIFLFTIHKDHLPRADILKTNRETCSHVIYGIVVQKR
jgi:hypothetical protein